jgi:hypothetical protein
MIQLMIPATKYSPMVELTSEGELTIKGRSILEDPTPFYNEIVSGIKKCSSKKFTLEIRIEYMNTSSTKHVLNLLKAVKDCYHTGDVNIKWFYEEDDEDMLEIGKDYESLIRIPIDFYEYSDNAA